jgi:hypothetical protein
MVRKQQILSAVITIIAASLSFPVKPVRLFFRPDITLSLSRSIIRAGSKTMQHFSYKHLMM